MHPRQDNAFRIVLRRYRLAAGVTQEALAERAGLSLRGLSDLERGERRAPYRDTVLRLAGALGLSGAEREELLASSDRRRGPAAMRAVGLGSLSLVPASSFVGRQNELSELRRLLPTVRLLTLTGTAGVGKTRLALELAIEASSDHRDGVWFVDLAPLADGSLVEQLVAATLGVREQPNRAVAETLADTLRDKRALLLLDNCEHVIGACAALLDRLLRACSGLRVLATSREPLRLASETIWRVPSLSPGQASVRSRNAPGEAVQLFVERATAVKPSFLLTDQNVAVVSDICRHLDGIPLAIELAAARVPLLPLVQIAARLDDRFQLLARGAREAPIRQQTLRAAIQWSYDLLSESERRLFTRLSVFAGGWTLEAAEHVCTGEDIASDSVLELLAGLVDQSLVEAEVDAGQSRFHLLETLRQFGRKEARGPDDALTRERHARYFLRFAEEAQPELWGSGAADTLMLIDKQHDNLRDALAWYLEAGDADGGLRLAASMAGYRLARGHLGEGRELLGEL